MKCFWKWLLAASLLAGLLAVAAALCAKQRNDAPDYITLYGPEDENEF